MKSFALWITLLFLTTAGWSQDALAPVASPPVSVNAQALTLPQAIQEAILHNLTTQLSRALTEEARGRVLQAASSLLPQITGTVQQQRVFKVNLESEGFPANNPFFSPELGPFNAFDARLQLVQTLLNCLTKFQFINGIVQGGIERQFFSAGDDEAQSLELLWLRFTQIEPQKSRR